MVLLLVLVVLVSSILTGDFTGSAGHQPGLPTDLQYVLSSLAESIEAQAINLTVTQAAQEISSQGTFAFSSLNAPVQAAFQNYLQAIFLENSTYCRNGDPVGPYVVCLTAYTMNVTQPPLQGQGFVPTFGGENGALNTSAVEVPFQVGITTESPFLGVEGVLDLEVFGGNGFLASGSYPFLQTTQVPLGLFDSSFNLWEASLSGPDSEFSRLAQYMLTSIAEIRALAGTGSGGPNGPDSGTEVSQILTPQDVFLAANLSLLLTTLTTFRTVNPADLAALWPGLPGGTLRSLLEGAVGNGTVDAATLFLYLEGKTNGVDWGSLPVATGAELAQSIRSFSDRFTFDLYRSFWGNNAVDPTLQEPVVPWSVLLHAYLGDWMEARLLQYLGDYGSWIGGQLVNAIEAVPSGATSTTAETYSAEVSCRADSNGQVYHLGNFSYTLLPAVSLSVSVDSPLSAVQSGAPPILDLLYGNSSPSWPFQPAPLRLYANLSLPNGTNMGGSGASYDPVLTYQVVDRSFLGEYSSTANSATDVVNWTYRQLLLDLANVTGEMSIVPAQAGYLATIASSVASNPTFGTPPTLGGSLPVPGTGSANVTNSSWGYLANGVPALFAQGSGALGQSLGALAGMTPSHVDSWFSNGAEHLGALSSSPPNPLATNSLGDAARLAVRLYYQLDYALFYGFEGNISTTTPVWRPPTATFSWTSGGDTPNPPSGGGGGPDFAQDVQTDTYGRIYDWVSNNTLGPSWNVSFNGLGGSYSGWSSAPPLCPASGGYTWYDLGPYHAAAVAFYSGGLWNFLASQLSKPAVAASYGTVQNTVGSAWAHVVMFTGRDQWSSYQVGSGGFGLSLQDTLGAAYLVPDTTAMLVGPNSWMTQLYDSSASWIGVNDQVHSVTYRPTILSDRPFLLWPGLWDTASSQGEVVPVAMPQVDLSMYDAYPNGPPTFCEPLCAPQVTVHFVDAQNTSTNMGAAPFQTTWTVGIQAKASVALTDPSVLLPGSGGARPMTLSAQAAIDAFFPVNVFTPWPLQSGAGGAPSDPPLELARSYLGYNELIPPGVSIPQYSYDYCPYMGLVMGTVRATACVNAQAPGGFGTPNLGWDFLQGADLPGASLAALTNASGAALSLLQAPVASAAGLLADLPGHASTSGAPEAAAWNDVVGASTSAVSSAAPSVPTTVRTEGQNLWNGVLSWPDFPDCAGGSPGCNASTPGPLGIYTQTSFLTGEGLWGFNAATYDTRTNTLSMVQGPPAVPHAPPIGDSQGIEMAFTSNSYFDSVWNYHGPLTSNSTLDFTSTWSGQGPSTPATGTLNATWSWYGSASSFDLTADSPPAAQLTCPAPSGASPSGCPVVPTIMANMPGVGPSTALSPFIAGNATANYPSLSPDALSSFSLAANGPLAASSPGYGGFEEGIQTLVENYSDLLLTSPALGLKDWEFGADYVPSSGRLWHSTAMEFAPVPILAGAYPSLPGFMGWELQINNELLTSLGDSTPSFGTFPYIPTGYLASLDWNVSSGPCATSGCAVSGAPEPGTPGGLDGSYLSVNFAALLTGPGDLGGGATSKPSLTMGGSGASDAWSATYVWG